jgi:hypothetical protein
MDGMVEGVVVAVVRGCERGKEESKKWAERAREEQGLPAIRKILLATFFPLPMRSFLGHPFLTTILTHIRI